MPLIMIDERALEAIERIDRAIARLEAAADRPTPAPQEGGELARLREAHLALRAKVEDAIGQIDRLLDAETV
jgi:hypothetical protein